MPRKNLRLVGGEPLVVHTIRAALSARTLDRTVVSTDGSDIARVAEQAGAEVPFLRPPDLAGDQASTVDVIRHAVGFLEARGTAVEAVVTLQPTSPFRTSAQIDEAVRMFRDQQGDSAVSVEALKIPASLLGLVDGPYFHPLYPTSDGRRQVAPPAWRINGAIYVTARHVLDSGRLLGDSVVAVPMEGAANIDIDTAHDLARARRLHRGLRQ